MLLNRYEEFQTDFFVLDWLTDRAIRVTPGLTPVSPAHGYVP